MIIAVEEKPRALQVSEITQKIFQVDEHIGVAAAGYIPDARVQVDDARYFSQSNKLTYDEAVEIETVAKHLADQSHQFTQYSGVRPFGVALIIAGVDRKGSTIYVTDPSGTYVSYSAMAIGSGSDEVNDFLEKNYSSEMSVDDCAALAIAAINLKSEEKSGVKPSKNNEPFWDSPWGKGRPGWHLECSVMSKKYLGDTFDIHGGGRDLIFPHHENEIAQSVCANQNKSFANYWVHNGFITMSNEKMAKSQGNILKINDFRSKINGQILRLALISSHYKQPLDWNDKLLDECQKTLDKWYTCYVKIKSKILIPEVDLNPLYDDLNTPGYLANLHKLFDKAQNGDLNNKETFVTACNFIGLLTETKDKWLSYKKIKISIPEKEILSKIKERDKARNNKDYALADKIRKELSDKGVLIEDKDGKTLWKFK